MCGRCALRTEVVRGPDYAGAEVILPDSIDNHSRCKGMIGGGQPLGQRQTPSRVVPFRLGLGSLPGALRIIENCGNSKCHRLTWIQVIASIENSGRRWILRNVPNPPDPLCIQPLVSLLMCTLFC